jgi:predicted nucleotidyltransferase
MAVLFGSTAIGEAREDSDVDLLVVHRNPKPLVLAGLRMRLRRALDKPVDVVDLEQAEAMPTLLADVLSEGKVVVDRDGLWEGLCARRSEIDAAAQREDRATMERAWAAVDAARQRLAAAGTPS